MGVLQKRDEQGKYNVYFRKSKSAGSLRSPQPVTV